MFGMRTPLLSLSSSQTHPSFSLIAWIDSRIFSHPLCFPSSFCGQDSLLAKRGEHQEFCLFSFRSSSSSWAVRCFPFSFLFMIWSWELISRLVTRKKSSAVEWGTRVISGGETAPSFTIRRSRTRWRAEIHEERYGGLTLQRDKDTV